MNGKSIGAGGEPALVPGELRGYRQFEVRADGLYPLVHQCFGPWDARLESARCARGRDHPAPASDCRCGLYAWYLPGSATVAVGPASAVISARGRCVLGDRGFRASQAHIEAVALPLTLRLNPRAAARTRLMLAERYPDVIVYASVRRMLKDHPPQDLSGLGIDPPRDRSRGYRSALVLLWATFLVVSYSMAVLPRGLIAGEASRWWPVILVLAVAWQAGMVWLISRLLALQGPGTTGGLPGRGH